MKSDTKQRPDGGRTPRDGNDDVTARHGRPGGGPGNTDATTHARPTQTGENDSRPADPDAPNE
jgi:hypothetical protein